MKRNMYTCMGTPHTYMRASGTPHAPQVQRQKGNRGAQDSELGMRYGALGASKGHHCWMIRADV